MYCHILNAEYNPWLDIQSNEHKIKTLKETKTTTAHVKHKYYNNNELEIHSLFIFNVFNTPYYIHSFHCIHNSMILAFYKHQNIYK